jgi:hypothetical protein
VKNHKDRWGQILLALVMGLSLFVLGCGVKQLTTEIWEDGSGRNIFIVAAAKEQDDPEQAAQQQESLEDSRQKAEECGARTLPYEDSVYKGYQATFDFRSFSEIPGQISCFLGDTTSLQIEGRYEERTEKETYQIETRIKPFSLWGLSAEDPMLYRVITPGQIVVYDNLQTDRVRTVKDGGNQVSWYFTKREDGDSDLEYSLTVEAEKLAPTAVVPPTAPPPVTYVVPTSVPPPTSPPPVTYVVPTSEVPSTSQPPPVTIVVPTSTASPTAEPISGPRQCAGPLPDPGGVGAGGHGRCLSRPPPNPGTGRSPQNPGSFTDGDARLCGALPGGRTHPGSTFPSPYRGRL